MPAKMLYSASSSILLRRGMFETPAIKGLTIRHSGPGIEYLNGVVSTSWLGYTAMTWYLLMVMCMSKPLTTIRLNRLINFNMAFQVLLMASSLVYLLVGAEATLMYEQFLIGLNVISMIMFSSVLFFHD